MKFSSKLLLSAATAGAILSGSVLAADVTKQRQKNTRELQHNIASRFQLVRSNMGPLGGMAGALPFDESVMETNAVRLSNYDMMGDYLSIDTRKFDVETGAKDEIWENFSDVKRK